jgi:hypothetical protein
MLLTSFAGIAHLKWPTQLVYYLYLTVLIKYDVMGTDIADFAKHFS